ncbi:MAG: hypothetical protein R6U35_07350 [Candidatus Humimicrobiaceae bacterium]
MESALKQVFFNALKRYIELKEYQGRNPYEIIGSGLSSDILMDGRLAMQKEVEKYMSILGSRGRAF